MSICVACGEEVNPYIGHSCVPETIRRLTTENNSLKAEVERLKTWIEENPNNTLVRIQKVTIDTQAIRLENLESQLQKAIEGLEFYADPDTYFAIAFIPDSPCGDFNSDFEIMDENGIEVDRAGKKARRTLNEIKGD